MKLASLFAAGIALAAIALPAAAHQTAGGKPAEPEVNRVAKGAPTRTAGEGMGPFRKLVIRGATLIDGTGAPPRGPVDIIVEGNRIADIKQAGWPGLAWKQDREPRDFDQEIDATGGLRRHARPPARTRQGAGRLLCL